MHSDCPGLVSIYRRHNYIYLLRFKVLMELIIIVCIKLMGTAISGHWACKTQGLHDTMSITLLCGLLGGSQGQTLDGSVGVRPIPCPALCLWHTEREQCGQILQPSLLHKNVTFSPIGHAWLPIWLRPVTTKHANNQAENVHIYISNSTTDCVNLGVRGQLRYCFNSLRLIVFLLQSSFKYKDIHDRQMLITEINNYCHVQLLI